MRYINFILAFLFYTVSYCQEIPSPTFTHETGFYQEIFNLGIESTAGDTILYTLDGSSPKVENLNGSIWNYKMIYPTTPADEFGELLKDTLKSYVYEHPILITDRSLLPDKYADISTTYLTNQEYYNQFKPQEHHVYKGTCVRAVAYRNGEYSDEVVGNFFIGNPDRYTLPIVCLAIEPNLFWGYEEGINVAGKVFDTWRADNPNAPLNANEFHNLWTAPANFRNKGDDTEFKINFTYIEEGTEQLNHGAGLRLNGNTSRYYPNKSLRLYAKSQYGPKNFSYPFFKDYDQQKFKRLLLRNGGQDMEELMIRDAFVQEASKKMNVITQAYEPIILFINGEYFGLYDIRERYDKKYFNRKYGIDEDSLDYIKVDEISEGDDVAFESLYNFVNSNDLTIPENYTELARRIDIENHIDYYIVETFMNNFDWPSNNNEFFRKRVPYDSTASYGNDGRFRWVLKDLDGTTNSRRNVLGYQSNDFEQFREPSGNVGVDHLILPFVKALKNKTFLHQFINRYCDILNSTYKKEVLQSKAEVLLNRIEPEIKEFAERWNPENQNIFYYWPIYSFNFWNNRTKKLYDFIENRSPWVLKYLQQEFDLSDLSEVIIDRSLNEGGKVQINTLLIASDLDGVDTKTYPWKGEYFSNIPIRLKAIPDSGFVFSHWSGMMNSESEEITVNGLSESSYFKAHFRKIGEEITKDVKPLIFPNPIHDKITLFLSSYVGRYELYDTKGNLLQKDSLQSTFIEIDPTLSKGIYYLKIYNEDGVFFERLMKE